MLLVTIRFSRYAGESVEHGIKEYIIVDDLEKAIQYINEKYLYNLLSNEDSEDNQKLLVSKKWWEKHPEKQERAKHFELIAEKKGTESINIVGSLKNIIRFWESNYIEETDEDPVTYYHWGKHQEITPEDAGRLIALGIAKRI